MTVSFGAFGFTQTRANDESPGVTEVQEGEDGLAPRIFTITYSLDPVIGSQSESVVFLSSSSSSPDLPF